MEEMQGEVQMLPGGRSSILFGGTRNTVKLSRPWQKPLEELIKPESCPFCTKKQEEFPLRQGSPPGWKLLPNTETPHPHHRLVVPDTCWDATKLARWGGATALTSAFDVASEAIEMEQTEMTLLVNVGFLAGQNLGHPHCHIFRSRAETPMTRESMLAWSATAPRVFETEHWVAAAGGTRAGSCIVAPKRMYLCNFGDSTSSLAEVLARLIILGNKKFLSKEGLTPLYGLIVRIAADGNVRYANYCPVLHPWGALEYTVSAMEGAPYTLPWSHETTAEHLRS